MEQLADTFLELSKYPFPLGSLSSPGEPQVDAFARESLTDSVGAEMRTIGTVSSLEEYHTSSLILDIVGDATNTAVVCWKAGSTVTLMGGSTLWGDHHQH